MLLVDTFLLLLERMLFRQLRPLFLCLLQLLGMLDFVFSFLFNFSLGLFLLSFDFVLFLFFLLGFLLHLLVLGSQ